MARKRKAKKASATSRTADARARALGKKLNALIAQARKVEAGTRKGAARQIQMLRRQQAVAKKALSKLGRQSKAASGPILAGLQKAWRNMDVAVRQGAKRFRSTT
jgi:hypothetical protein